jgi:hypothetical protein
MDLNVIDIEAVRASEAAALAAAGGGARSGDESLGSASRRVHPLKAWRMTRRIVDHGRRQPRNWTVADAARSFSAFTGRAVPYQTWRAWERYEDEEGARRPDASNMRDLYLFTNGQLRPDHYYDLDAWRAELAGARADEAAGGAAGENGNEDAARAASGG